MQLALVRLVVSLVVQLALVRLVLSSAVQLVFEWTALLLVSWSLAHLLAM